MEVLEAAQPHPGHLLLLITLAQMGATDFMNTGRRDQMLTLCSSQVVGLGGDHTCLGTDGGNPSKSCKLNVLEREVVVDRSLS